MYQTSDGPSIRTLVIAAIAIGLALTGLALANARRATLGAGPLRVGTYDSRAVAVAAIRSGTTDAQVKELRAKLSAAEHAGDKVEAERIKKRGATLQQLRHLQGFSNAPVDDLLDPVRTHLPEIAAKAGVAVIVAHADYTEVTVETVDVTDEIVALYNPNVETLNQLKQLRKQKPAPMLDILLHQD